MMIRLVGSLPALVLCVNVWAAERPYAFHAELETVHEEGLRDVALRPETNEFSFANGAVVSVPGGSELLRRVGGDFVDCLASSHGVSARVAVDEDSAVLAVGLDGSLAARSYRIETTASGVRILAADERSAAQAFYHLEDVMGLRRAPFLPQGSEVRRARFSPRMIHSGWGIDTFPEPYLIRAAHHGFDAILVFVPETGRTQRGWADINSIIRRAAKWGIDTYLYSYVNAPVHPADPQAPDVFQRTYGAIAHAYPGARGYIFVGESCQFPSRDPRTNGKIRPNLPEPGDERPYPCMYPCEDYPDWLLGVRAAIVRENPKAEIVFWTYNFGRCSAEERLPLIRRIPTEVSLLVTFEMYGDSVKRNGLKSRVWDYSLSNPGPGSYYLSEAVECGRLGHRLYAQANTAGLTWDLGTVPYLPCPQLWKKRWDRLCASQREHGLVGLMEGHHYGWTPSFVTELSKEAFTDGGLPFDEHLRKIVARDFGAAHVRPAIEAWRLLSDAVADSYPVPQNLAGPYRIGPAYPFNFGGRRIDYEDVPFPKASPYLKSYCWTYFNYLEDFSKGRFPPVIKTDWDRGQLELELELLRAMVCKADSAADLFESLRPDEDRQRRKVRRAADLSRYMARCWTTVANLKRGVLAVLAKDNAALLAAARDEYANKEATLPLVDRDSRLGWEPSMDYIGGRAMIEWSMKLMRETYGEVLEGKK